MPLVLEFALIGSSRRICATSAQPFWPLDPEVAALIPPIPTVCSPVDTRAVTGLLPEFTVTDTAVSMNDDGDRIAICMATASTSSTTGDWLAFFNGDFAPSTSGASDFSVFLETSVLEAGFEDHLSAEIACDPLDPGPGCNDDLDLNEPIEVTYFPLGVPMVTTHAYVDVHTPMCADIGVDVWLGYKVPPPGPTLAAWGAPLARVEAPKR